MVALWNQTQNQKVIGDLQIATSLWSRMRGLLGTQELPHDRALWILACNSIHTFFMKYPIDCVFLDKNMCIESLVSDVRPGRMVWPKWRATSVIEMRSGSIQKMGLRTGDQLNVGT